MVDDVEGADAAGLVDELVMRGDAAVAGERQVAAREGARARLAVEALLDKIVTVGATVAVDKDAVEIERAMVKERAGLVPKTISKVETDMRTWDLYVKEQQVEIDAYPSIEQAPKCSLSVA